MISPAESCERTLKIKAPLEMKKYRCYIGRKYGDAATELHAY